MSYAIGISTGAGYKENLKTLPGDPANVDDLIAGFIQAIKGDSSAMKMTPQAAQAYVQTYLWKPLQEMPRRRRRRRKVLG